MAVEAEPVRGGAADDGITEMLLLSVVGAVTLVPPVSGGRGGVLCNTVVGSLGTETGIVVFN